MIMHSQDFENHVPVHEFCAVDFTCILDVDIM